MFEEGRRRRRQLAGVCRMRKMMLVVLMVGEVKSLKVPSPEVKKLKQMEYLQNPYYLDGDRPAGAAELGVRNFVKQGSTIIGQILEEAGLVEKDPLKPPECLGFVLSNEAVAEAEARRERLGGRVEAHPVSRALYDLGCIFLDRLFDERPIPRFFFLEVVARIPYFSYTSMLHLYESFGWWRAADLRRVHGAEEWNELHHLLIMEALGGNALWSDRFFAYHAAFIYYWLINLVFLCSPSIAYQFMELLEAHAGDTYGTFLIQNKARLQELPPPAIAKVYYTSNDLYFFDDFQVSRRPGTRRPPCDTLYDVFKNIMEDEAEHVKTMIACQKYCNEGTPIVSPFRSSTASPLQEPQTDTDRKVWKAWADDVNQDAKNKVSTLASAAKAVENSDQKNHNKTTA